jgi:hypothetical protein
MAALNKISAPVWRAAVDAAKKHFSQNKPEIIGRAAVGGTAALLGYASAKRWQGKPSFLEQEVASWRAGQRQAHARLKKKGKKPGLGTDLGDAVAKSSTHLAKVMSDYPVATSVLWGTMLNRHGAQLAEWHTKGPPWMP